MPYKSIEKQREANRRYYLENREKEFARVRRFRNKKSGKSVTEPVTEPDLEIVYDEKESL